MFAYKPEFIKFFLFKLAIFYIISIYNLAIAGVALSENNFNYLGAFNVPQVTSISNNPFVNAQYQPIAYNPRNNSLFIGQTTGPETSPKRVAEISIPTIINPLTVNYDVTKLNVSVLLKEPTDISEGAFDKLTIGGGVPSDEAKAQLGGLLVFGDKLFGTAWAYYDASSGTSYRSHWTLDLSLDWTGPNSVFSGLHAVGLPPINITANGGFVGGYMAEVPDEYKLLLGSDLVTGRVGGPIVGRSSYGPTLWTFAHDELNFDNPASAKMLLGYTTEHQTIGGYDDGPSLTFSRGSGVKGLVWPKNSANLFFFGQHGFGISYDSAGVPLTNPSPNCVGPGTSSRNKAQTNDWLKNNSPGGWVCGVTVMTAQSISGGASCCFDPINPVSQTHSIPFVVGQGESCYGPGTSDYTIARTKEWLKANTPSGYQCGGSTISSADIAADNACCYVGTGSTAKGGSSYPFVYQVWQYNVEDLMLVKNGSKNPWEILPTVWNFDLPFANPARIKQLLSATYDSSTNRVYIGQTFGNGNYPVIHVFEIVYPPKAITNLGIN